MKNLKSLVPLLLFASFGCASAAGMQNPTPEPNAGNGDEPDSPLEPYSDLITDEAVTDSGVFHVHTVGDKLYFESFSGKVL